MTIRPWIRLELYIYNIEKDTLLALFKSVSRYTFEERQNGIINTLEERQKCIFLQMKTDTLLALFKSVSRYTLEERQNGIIYCTLLKSTKMVSYTLFKSAKSVSFYDWKQIHFWRSQKFIKKSFTYKVLNPKVFLTK